MGFFSELYFCGIKGDEKGKEAMLIFKKDNWNMLLLSWYVLFPLHNYPHNALRLDYYYRAFCLRDDCSHFLICYCIYLLIWNWKNVLEEMYRLSKLVVLTQFCISKTFIFEETLTIIPQNEKVKNEEYFTISLNS